MRCEFDRFSPIIYKIAGAAALVSLASCGSGVGSNQNSDRVDREKPFSILSNQSVPSSLSSPAHARKPAASTANPPKISAPRLVALIDQNAQRIVQQLSGRPFIITGEILQIFRHPGVAYVILDSKGASPDLEVSVMIEGPATAGISSSRGAAFVAQCSAISPLTEDAQVPLTGCQLLKGSQEETRSPNEGIVREGVDFNAQANSASSTPNSCMVAIGRQRAEQLVDQCLMVSPATRPPCNMANSCELITSEIVRGCRYIGLNAPTFCSDYR